ncbi:MAG: HD domain-containing phosphohydrolase [Oryzomonas sp.]|jgi:putative two-component system response regulator
MKLSLETILCVDDDNLNLEVYRTILQENGYKVVVARTGAEALHIVASAGCDLIVLDYLMPVMNGVEVCRILRSHDSYRHLPIVLATSFSDRELKLLAFEAGVSDFIAKPVDHVELLSRIRNLLKLKEYHDFVVGYNLTLKKEVEQKTLELRDSYIETITRLSIAAEYWDKDTANHLNRMANYARLLAVTIGLPEDDVELIYYAAPMHDIGKIGIPNHILNKPGRLNKTEKEIIRSHSRIGANILANSNSPILRKAESIALHHHEYMDGSGYPHGKRGEEIPLEGRLLTLVDIYDALRMRRSYKPPFSHRKAFKLITKGDGRTKPNHFDPLLLDAFKGINEKFDEIFSGNTLYD